MPAWNDYSTKDSPDNTDTLMIKDETGTGKPNKRLSFANLAKFIIEQYTGSTISGAKRSVKAAVDVLGDNVKNLKGTINASSAAADINDCNDIPNGSIVYTYRSALNSPPNAPCEVFTFGLANELTKIQFAVSKDAIAIRWYSVSTWTAWILQPTRSEMDGSCNFAKTAGNDSIITNDDVEIINGTGTIFDVPKITKVKNTLFIHGRIRISDFVRTGSGPGISITLPSGTVSVQTKTNNIYVGVNAVLPKEMMMLVFPSADTINIRTTESYSNQSNNVFCATIPLTAIDIS